jgi:hypothetical protein
METDNQVLAKLAERIKQRNQRKEGKWNASLIKIVQIIFIAIVDLFSDLSRLVYSCYQWIMMRLYARSVRNLYNDRSSRIVSATINTIDITDYVQCYFKTERVISIYTLREWLTRLPAFKHDKPKMLTLYATFADAEQERLLIKKAIINLDDGIELISKKQIEDLDDIPFSCCSNRCKCSPESLDVSIDGKDINHGKS